MSFPLKLRRNPDAPRLSLRERYAALKGSAAKVMRRQPPGIAQPKLPGAGTPSKALAAALAAHEMAYGYALYTEAYGLPDLAEPRQAEEEAFRALLHMPLHSDADRAAYAAAVISRQMHALGDATATERDHPMAVAFRNIAFGEHAREPEEMRHLRRGCEPDADPILAAIEAHRAAWATWAPLLDTWNDTVFGTPEHDKAEAAAEKPRERERVAFNALLSTRPTTPAGLWALATYLPEAMRQSSPDTDPEALSALDALRAAALAIPQTDGGRPKVAEAAAAQEERHGTAPAKVSAEKVDLKALDVMQLVHLHEAFQAARYVWEGARERRLSIKDTDPRGFVHLTAAGELADFEEDRAGRIMDRIVDEMASRTPRNEEEHDRSLVLRLRHELDCEDRIRRDDLMREITQAWGA